MLGVVVLIIPVFQVGIRLHLNASDSGHPLMYPFTNTLHP